MTKEQEEFLVKFADQELEKIALEEQRVADAEAKRLKERALEGQRQEIILRKEAELKAELEALEG